MRRSEKGGETWLSMLLLLMILLTLDATIEPNSLLRGAVAASGSRALFLLQWTSMKTWQMARQTFLGSHLKIWPVNVKTKTPCSLSPFFRCNQLVLLMRVLPVTVRMICRPSVLKSALQCSQCLCL